MSKRKQPSSVTPMSSARRREEAHLETEQRKRARGDANLQHETRLSEEIAEHCPLAALKWRPFLSTFYRIPPRVLPNPSELAEWAIHHPLLFMDTLRIHDATAAQALLDQYYVMEGARGSLTKHTMQAVLSQLFPEDTRQSTLLQLLRDRFRVHDTHIQRTDFTLLRHLFLFLMYFSTLAVTRPFPYQLKKGHPPKCRYYNITSISVSLHPVQSPSTYARCLQESVGFRVGIEAPTKRMAFGIQTVPLQLRLQEATYASKPFFVLGDSHGREVDHKWPLDFASRKLDHYHGVKKYLCVTFPTVLGTLCFEYLHSGFSWGDFAHI
jgi:hypothetical protein